MRRSTETHWLEHHNNLMGIRLGADYCAEHEWGIEGIITENKN